MVTGCLWVMSLGSKFSFTCTFASLLMFFFFADYIVDLLLMSKLNNSLVLCHSTK